MAEHGVAALSHPPSGERVRTGPADPSGAWDQDHPPSTETTTQESGLRENRTSRLSERTEEGRKPDLLRLYEDTGSRQLALDVAVQIARCLSHEHQFRGSLLSPPNEGRRRAGEPARDHLGSETVRSAKVLFAHQPHVGWLVVPGQSAHMGASSPRHPGRRVEERQCRRCGGARGRGPTEYELDW